ncbi:MAG: outer membrane beta-barrel protein, partial [Bryobacteraceae bacterium]|nr:outer membrane beta-barrel protein [Bryobacteraceae bacterium]
TARQGDDEEFTQFGLSLGAGMHSGASDDNYVDYSLGYLGNYMMAGNVALSPRLGYEQAHETRGSGGSKDCLVDPSPSAPTGPGGTVVFCPSEPDIYTNALAGLSLTLGNKESRGRLTAGLSRDVRRFDDNPGREYDLNTGTLKLAWRVGGKTDAVVEVNATDYDYISAPSDNKGTEVLAGVEWDITGKTTGYAKAGRQEKNFSAANKKDIDDTAWRIGVDFLPTDQSALNLQYDRRIDESEDPGVGDAKEVTILSGRFSFKPNERLEPYLALSSTQEVYQGGTGREDDLRTIGLGVDYKFRRFAVLGASWTTTDQQSDAGTAFEYERGVFALTANLSM